MKNNAELCLFLQLIASYQLGEINSSVSSECRESGTITPKMFNIAKNHLVLNQLLCQQMISQQILK